MDNKQLTLENLKKALSNNNEKIRSGADVNSSFLTELGYGGLRYYQNKLQYYDKDKTEWIDLNDTKENLVMLTPNDCPSFKVFEDYSNFKVKIKVSCPSNTILDGQLLCNVKGVKVVKKQGSYPKNENDGEVLFNVNGLDKNKYSKNWFIDNDVETGNTYYYQAFPYSDLGIINRNETNRKSITIKDYEFYGFKLDQNESDPESMITYLDECDNKEYKSAYMNFSKDKFDYGDWEDSFFIRNLKPCMLKYDGTVAYELNPNDFTKKKDSNEDSDVSNELFEGNAMIGVPKVYYKIVDNGDDTANIYISNKKIDENYVCWSHIDNNGNEIDYCYMPAYCGSLDSSNRLRSLSGKLPISLYSVEEEVSFSLKNNITESTIWYTEVYCDRLLINLLCLLISKNTDSQSVFGTGNSSTYVSASETGISESGTLNNKSLFYGKNDSITSVKIFGIENYYSNVLRRNAGYINDNGIIKVKLTYGKNDGSKIIGYNFDGSGYISINNKSLNLSDNFISHISLSNNGFLVNGTNGSSSTYFTDGLWYKSSQICYAMFGGSSSHTENCGIFCMGIHGGKDYKTWGISAALSCKPLANISQE